MITATIMVLIRTIVMLAQHVVLVAHAIAHFQKVQKRIRLQRLGHAQQAKALSL
jgi:hypothetical protein